MNLLFKLPALIIALVISASLWWYGIDEYPIGEEFTVDAGDGNSDELMRNLDPPYLMPHFVFIDRKGQERNLSEYRGKVVLLNIWATWCAPCRKEMPSLDRLQSTFGNSEFQVLAIATDEGGVGIVQGFYRKFGIKELEVFVDESGESMSKHKVVGLPTTLLIDRSGNAIDVKVGSIERDSEEAILFINEKLSSSI